MQLSQHDQAKTVGASAVGGAVGAKFIRPGVAGAAAGAAAGTAGAFAARRHQEAAKVVTKPGSRAENKHPNVRGY